MQAKNNIICLVLGLLAGIFGTITVNHNAQFTPDKIAQQTAANSLAATLQSNAALAQSYYESKVDTLQQANAILSKKVAATQTELQKAKGDKQVLLSLVDGLIARVDSAGFTDTASRLATCDTLQTAVQELVASAKVTDSLYEDVTMSLGKQLTNRDSVITTQQLEYASLSITFDESLLQQQLLSGQVAGYQKQANRFRAKNKLLSAGVMLLTGIAAYGILHH